MSKILPHSSLLSQLSSQIGERTEEANKKIAKRCVQHPTLLKEIAIGLKQEDVALVGDCAEVFTKVAETHPKFVQPYAKDLIFLLNHKKTRVRWEATHAIALIASLVPKRIATILPHLQKMALTDESTIVRDCAVIAIGNYARANKEAAKQALPLLKRVLDIWKEKQAARAIYGLQNVVETNPALSERVRVLVKPFEKSSKGTVKKALKNLLELLAV